ncbi:MAG TPA: 3-ketoacyl-ACP reductase [Terracidiphilus sp.]|nr:3-ketoacyl-ACP reductase [Terracidiphilus sp.]
MSLKQCERPVAIVTGAFRGIGHACTLGLAKVGFNLLLNDRDGDENRELAPHITSELADLGADSLPIFADVAKLEIHSTMLDAAISRWGRIDCLVNNAGVPAHQRGDLLDVEPESFDECISVNTRAVFFLSQAVARQMLEQSRQTDTHRSIINITSSNAKAVSITRSEYCVSKAASSMTTKLFALRLASAGIGVYEVRPGIIETDLTRPAKSIYDKIIDDHHVPAERWGYPADVASTVVCMAEGRLVYTVGQAIAVDGGLVIPRY